MAGAVDAFLDRNRVPQGRLGAGIVPLLQVKRDQRIKHRNQRRRLSAQFFLENGEGAPQIRLRHRVTLVDDVEAGQIRAIAGQVEIGRPFELFAQPDHPQVRQLGLGAFAHCGVEGGQQFEIGNQVEAVADGLLINGKRALEEPLGVRVMALGAMQRGQRGDRAGQAEVFNPRGLFLLFESAGEERLGFGVSALRHQQRGLPA